MAYNEFLKEHKEKKTKLKFFLENKTMLTGKITNFDDNFIIVDKCLVNVDHLISIAPEI